MARRVLLVIGLLVGAGCLPDAPERPANDDDTVDDDDATDDDDAVDDDDAGIPPSHHPEGLPSTAIDRS